MPARHTSNLKRYLTNMAVIKWSAAADRSSKMIQASARAWMTMDAARRLRKARQTRSIRTMDCMVSTALRAYTRYLAPW